MGWVVYITPYNGRYYSYVQWGGWYILLLIMVDITPMYSGVGGILYVHVHWGRWYVCINYNLTCTVYILLLLEVDIILQSGYAYSASGICYVVMLIVR